MTPERWQAIKDVFFGALEQEAGDRRGFLAEACAGDRELQQQVEDLLADHEHAETFIESPALDEDSYWPGRELGAYRILEKIDEGGMGTVYLAQRSDAQYSQKVAIKLIRWGMASQLIVARFRQERQILAHLNHPGIARLLDGGTTAKGQPYLVMEYIEGEPVDDYCDRHRLSIDERLELFRKVCAAVHYAHQNLVVHRDIKPSNILVTAAGEPKLLDFGTAKLLEPALAEPGLVSTAPGLRQMTPEYASPEQLRAEPITTASDVYALGVVLYELLAGRRPYRFTSRHSPEVLRIVCEQEPEKPSAARVTPPAATARRELPHRLRRRLGGDLDNIVLLALRKEPQRRYASVEQMSDDIRRHLAGLPVLARKDTWSYHFSKFVRRHRVAVVAGALAVLAVLAGTVTALWQAARAELHLAEANEQRVRNERVAEFLKDIFNVSSPSEARGQPLTAREVLEQAEVRIHSELRDQPKLRAELMDSIGVVYHNIGLYERAASLLEKALELRLQVVEERHVDVAASWFHLGRLALDRGRYEEAESLLERSLDLRRELLGDKDSAVAATLDDLGRVRYARADYAEAEKLHRRALELRRELFGPESPEVAESLNNLATDLAAAGRPEESEPLIREALRIYRELFGNRHPATNTTLYNLAILLYSQDNYEAAEPRFRDSLEIGRELLGDENPSLAINLDSLAIVLQRQGKLEEAEALYREALDLRSKLLEPGHPDIAYSLNNLAVLMQERRRYDEAEELYRQALALRLEALESGHPAVAQSLANLGDLLRATRRYGEARALYHQALAICRESLRDGHELTVSIESKLAEIAEPSGA